MDEKKENIAEGMAPLFCTACGAKLKAGSKFCTGCGQKIETVVSANSDVAKNTPVQAENPASQANATAQTEAAPRKGFPIALVIVLIVVGLLIIGAIAAGIYFILGRAGGGTKHSAGSSYSSDENDYESEAIVSSDDLSRMIDYTEEEVLKELNCEKNDLGMYPNGDNVNVMCLEGKVYYVAISAKYKSDSGKCIKSISIGENINDIESKLKNFTFDTKFDIVDGIRYSYTEKENGNLLGIDTDNDGKIIYVVYSADNNSDSYSGEAKDNSETSDAAKTVDDTVTVEDASTTEAAEEVYPDFPDYCSLTRGYGNSEMLGYNSNSGYEFVIEDYGFEPLSKDNANELLYKMALLSNFGHVSVVIYQYSEYTNINDVAGDVAGQYILDRGYSPKDSYIVLAEVCKENGEIWYGLRVNGLYDKIFSGSRLEYLSDSIKDYRDLNVGFVDEVRNIIEMQGYNVYEGVSNLTKVKVDAPDGYVNFRSSPEKGNNIIAKIYNGESLYIQDTQGDWGYTNYGGESGWIHMSQVANDYSSDDFLLDGSDEFYFYEDSIRGFTAWECKVARNEIYARHGRKFKDKQLQSYFDSQNWYEPRIEADDFSESMLSKVEKANVDMIKAYEKKMGY